MSPQIEDTRVTAGTCPTCGDQPDDVWTPENPDENTIRVHPGRSFTIHYPRDDRDKRAYIHYE